jgi:hypothetical protein
LCSIINQKQITMKKDLTENQKQIITDITNEFVKINERETKRKSNSLIDFDSIFKERKEDEKRREEILCKNVIVQQMYDNLIDEIVDKLTLEVDEWGLYCRKNDNTRKHSGDIIIGYTDELRYKNYIYIEVRKDISTITFKSGIEEVREWLPPTRLSYNNVSNSWETIEELCKYPYFIKELKELLLKMEQD